MVIAMRLSTPKLGTNERAFGERADVDACGHVGSRFRGLVRLGVFVIAAGLFTSTFALRSAYGRLGESGQIIGRELAKFDDLLGTTSRVRLNGEAMYVSSALSTESAHQVLDRFEAHCREHAGGLPELFAKLPESLKKDFDENLEGGAGMGIARREADGEGFIACIAQREGGDIASLPKRMVKMLQTGDLSEVGNLRYVYARQTPGQSTHVITVWTDGPFNIFNIAPQSGAEAPGSDSEESPRPPHATRLLSVSVDGSPQRLRLYDVSAGRDSVIHGFDAEMSRRGFSPIDLRAAAYEDARAYSKDGHETLLFVTPDGPDRTLLSLIDTVAEPR